MKQVRKLKIFFGVLLFSAPMFGMNPSMSIDGYTGATTVSQQKSAVGVVKAKAKKKASKAVLVTSSPNLVAQVKPFVWIMFLPVILMRKVFI